MPKSVLPTSEFTDLLTFFAAGKYMIPPFQRDFSWEKDHTQEFWEDAWNTYDEKVNNYFFGPVVLIDENKSDTLKIVDGQQRITTLNIFMILIRDILKSNGNDVLATRIEAIFKQLEISQSNSPPKLVLNQNNNHFFEENIFPYSDPETKSNLPIPPLKTNGFLLKAYKQLFSEIKKKPVLQTDDNLAQFAEKILKSFEVIIIKVDSERKAYRIFATLNQRGKNLADSDLIKNYILEMSDVVNVTPHNNRWMEISQELDNTKLDEFLRHSWMATNGFIQKQKLYENITKKIGNNADVSAFLILLDQECDVYKELRFPTKTFWGNDRNVNYIKDLFGKFNNDSAQSLFLAAHRKWGNSNEFKQLPRICMDLHFRCKTIGPKTASAMVAHFVEAAEDVRDNNGKLEDVKKILKKLDITNSDFQTRIQNKNDFSGTVAKYLLREINSHLLTTRPITTLTDDGTLEHILPQTMNDDWKKDWSPTEHDKVYERIGNLTLVHGVSNSEMGNKSFEEKKEIYEKQNDVKITLDLSKISKWDAKAIEDRSENFAGDVSLIWLSLVD